MPKIKLVLQGPNKEFSENMDFGKSALTLTNLRKFFKAYFLSLKDTPIDDIAIKYNGKLITTDDQLKQIGSGFSDGDTVIFQGSSAKKLLKKKDNIQNQRFSKEEIALLQSFLKTLKENQLWKKTANLTMVKNKSGDDQVVRVSFLNWNDAADFAQKMLKIGFGSQSKPGKRKNAIPLADNGPYAVYFNQDECSKISQLKNLSAKGFLEQKSGDNKYKHLFFGNQSTHKINFDNLYPAICKFVTPSVIKHLKNGLIRMDFKDINVAYDFCQRLSQVKIKCATQKNEDTEYQGCVYLDTKNRSKLEKHVNMEISVLKSFAKILKDNQLCNEMPELKIVNDPNGPNRFVQVSFRNLKNANDFAKKIYTQFGQAINLAQMKKVIHFSEKGPYAVHFAPVECCNIDEYLKKQSQQAEVNSLKLK